MKNIHILSTDKPSRLYSYKSIDLYLHSEIVDANSANLNCKNQNIYITSDEEIKKEDWCMSLCDDESYEEIYQCKNINLVDEEDKKIILTDNTDLIANGVQSIDDDFLEWFVKNPSCENVEVESFCKHGDNCPSKGAYDKQDLCDVGYEIILPKEDLSYTTKMGVKIPDELVRATMIPKKYFGRKEEPKQETLEESNKTTAIRFLEWYRLKKVIYQFHCYHIPNINDKSWEQTVFFGENSYLNADQLFEIFKKENYEKRNT